MYYLNGGVGELEALRKPLVVNRATYERARNNLAFQSMHNRIDPSTRPVWFRNHKELYVPYWTLPEYRERDGRDPSASKSGLLYQPFWMTNKSRTRLIQRPNLQIKPRSEVLYHLGTDEDDGLGKGFNPLKAIKKVVKVVAKPKVLFNVATGGLYGIAKAGIDAAKGKTSIIGGLKTAVASYGPAGMVLTPAIGTNKSLAIQAAVAGAALAPAIAAGGGTLLKLGQQVLPAATAALTKESVPVPEPVPTSAGVPTYAYPPEGYGPSPGGPSGMPPPGPMQAGIFGGMDPLTIGLLIGVPVVLQLLMRERK